MRKARGILNKLCPQKFDILVEKFNELQIDDEDKLRSCIELIFEKVCGIERIFEKLRGIKFIFERVQGIKFIKKKGLWHRTIILNWHGDIELFKKSCLAST